MKFELYLFDTLMQDLVGHDRAASAYLVYLQLYRNSVSIGSDSVTLSHATLAEMTGLSKRAVQNAIDHLERRELVIQSRAYPTATPTYRVQTPWRRIYREPLE